jgi:WD40 repeat protein
LTLVSESLADSFKIWDVATALEQPTSRTEVQGIRAVAFSADRLMVVAAKSGGNTHLWDAFARCEQTSYLGKFHTLCSALSTDGMSLALGDIDGTVRVRDLSRVVDRRLKSPVLFR